VNEVPNGALFTSTIGANFNRSQTSGKMGIQSWPRPCVIMKLTISGVTFSAAQMKSPSFSRSSASITITTLPALTAATTASIDEYSATITSPLGFLACQQTLQHN